jgi:hypothetical protein
VRRIRGIDDSAPDRPCPIDFDSASVKLQIRIDGNGLGGSGHDAGLRPIRPAAPCNCEAEPGQKSRIRHGEEARRCAGHGAWFA